MSKFRTKYKELGGWDFTTNIINDYRERVTDDPMLKRGCTATDIGKRIRSAIHKVGPDDVIELGETIIYRARFTKRGQFYYILTKQNISPKRFVSLWTEEIYQNYLSGITSKGNSIFEHRKR